MRVKIVVDSTVDLSPAIREKVTAVVPLSIRFGETEYKDGETIDAHRFYDMLVKSETLPTTSQPTPTAFEDAYREATADGSQVVVITIASKLSGTYQSATIAAEEFPGQVFVVDSRNAALGSGILTEYAVGLAEEGKSGEEILALLMEKRKQIRLYAIVDTLEYLKKGGRLSSTVAFVGGMLNLKPIISLEDGVINTVGKARGMKKAFEMLSAECAKNGGVDYDMPVLLGYTGGSDEQLKAYMAEYPQLWSPDTPTSIVGATIGVHAGPGAVAVAVFEK